MLVSITGHQDIPGSALAFVKNKITKTLEQLQGPVTGVSSLAAGADQLFAEAVLRNGGNLHIVIPCDKYETTFQNKPALNRFLRLLKEADTVETLKNPRPSERAFLEAGHRVVDLSSLLIAVWDGQNAKGKGGTGDIVRYAHECGKTVVIVWPRGIVR